ncbi:MAG: poly-gamma-glutamate synthase PgsB [bacterium]|jgi:poly-gamma-glutamate synthase PgsB/CapB
MFLVLVLVLLVIGYGIAEYQIHLRNLKRIPIRVQVNGTRGKSSVTRLIAAGLRAGGYRVVAKVTGTKPRFIVGDREEYPVRRLGKANIIEELRIVRLARKYQAQALVIECMALVPEYQRTENRMLIRPTHGVITNVRADHLDVMGPTVMDVARALSNTVPVRGRFFTAERGAALKVLKQRLRPGVEMKVTDPATVSDEEIAGFSYIEHKENVALALAVCESLGVERKTALQGMQRSLPDSGVMRIYRIVDRGKELELVNTLAANDPDSINMLWQMVKGRNEHRIVLVNCRRDRADRSRQLAELVRDWEFDYAVITGGLTKVFIHRAIQLGVPKEKLRDFGDEIEPAVVYQGVWELIKQSALVFATGNTVGYGEKLINCFVIRGELDDN